MKILIVDDEQIERMALEKIIQTHIPYVHIIGQAENGRKAIELVTALEPDLILMDIKMPGMDGLEAVKEIHAQHAHIKFIIVSAFDTFEYAQKALRLGVKDYLLKPSKTQVIVETIQKVLETIQQEQNKERMQVEVLDRLERLLPVVETDLVTQLLYDYAHDVHLNEMMELLGFQQATQSFVIVLFIQREDHLAMDDVYLLIKEQFHQIASGWVGAMAGKQIPMIVLHDQSISHRAAASSLIRKILQLADKLQGVNFFIGVGEPYDSLEKMKNSYHEAMLASVDMTLSNRHCFFAELSQHSFESLTFTFEVEKEILQASRKGDWDSVEQMLDRLLDSYEIHIQSVHETQQRIFEVLLIISRLLQDMGMQIDRPMFSFQATNYQQLRTETMCVLEKIIQQYMKIKNGIEPDVILRMKQYVIDHAHQDISLERIAEQVNLNPFYISKLFKEQLGTNYIDFLTECRMNKAKQLMNDPSKSMKEITFDVGYKDPNYFSRAFKKQCGISPTEYRKQLFS